METTHSLSDDAALLIDTVKKLAYSNNLEEVTTLVRSAARQLTGADGATFVLREGNLCHYADEDAISPLWKGSRFPMDSCISGWVMLHKKPVIIEDIYVDDRIPEDAYRPTFVKSLAMVPIRTEEPVGAIGNYWATHYHPTDREMTLLQTLADVTAVQLENIAVRERLVSQLEERTQMLDQLEKQKTQLNEFAHILAHNMRAPLANLQLLHDMAYESEDIEEKLMLMEKQKSVLDSLGESLDELVDAVQVKMDFSVTPDHVEFEPCLQKALKPLQGELLASGATVEGDFTKARAAYFPAPYLDSILFNLVSNALKYRSPDRTPHIRLKSYKKDGWTYLEVSDNGLGIDLKQHRGNMFKLRKTFHAHPRAKGFGLFITKTQIETMGGSIDVESVPDVGSTFSLKLHQNK